MCGIAGLWAPRLEPGQRSTLVAAMVERLRHRGPSGAALWNGEGVTLGLARLAIVARGEPALVHGNESGALHAVVNGELYNHIALRRELHERGHDVARGPDTALVAHLYEEHGDDFPLHIDGMFAIAIWNAAEQSLVLARDRAGEKPLFVTEAPQGVAFASEPGALLALPWLSRDPSPASLARYLAHGFFAGEDCGFAAVRQLPPGHLLAFRNGVARQTRYWRPWDTLVSRRRSARGDAPAATADALARSVASRTPDEVPFGVFLSGGVDSGLVSVLAERARGRGFPTFSVRLPDRGYDESAFARAVAASIGSEHHELVMDHAGGEEAIERFACDMDQPIGDPSVLPTWALARLAARHVPVVLTGEGGDELFAGYPTYLGHRHAALARRIPRGARAALIALVRALRPRHHHVALPHLIERFLEAGSLRPFERHLAWFGTARASEAMQLLAPGLRSRINEDAPLAHLDRLERDLAGTRVGDLRRAPALVAYQLLDFEFYLSGDLLTKVDRCAMAHGVEARAPFLSHELIEFALALPEDARLRGTCGKWALKRAARGLLPRALLARRKQGFSPPFSAWARGPLRALVTERLSPERLARAQVLDPAATAALMRAHLDGRIERGRTLWALLSLQMWAERWVASDRHAGTPAAAAALVSPRSQ